MHNHTCQWFYAAFIHNAVPAPGPCPLLPANARSRVGSPPAAAPPLAPAPFYGLEANTGLDYFSPWVDQDSADNDKDSASMRPGSEGSLTFDHSLSEKGTVQAIQAPASAAPAPLPLCRCRAVLFVPHMLRVGYIGIDLVVVVRLR